MIYGRNRRRRWMGLGVLTFTALNLRIRHRLLILWWNSPWRDVFSSSPTGGTRLTIGGSDRHVTTGWCGDGLLGVDWHANENCRWSGGTCLKINKRRHSRRDRVPREYLTSPVDAAPHLHTACLQFHSVGQRGLHLNISASSTRFKDVPNFYVFIHFEMNGILSFL